MPKEGKETHVKRQAKHQRPPQAHQTRREQDEKSKTGKFPTNKLFLGVALIVMIVTAYGIWQYNESQKIPTITGASGNLTPTGSAPNFSIKDINGTQVSLSQFNGSVIGIHFMAVGCHGQINQINEYQLSQLSGACNNLCGKYPAAFLTVAVATCQSSDLDVLRSNYSVTWTLGNDYDDGAIEIVNAYVPYKIGDGAVVLIDRSFNIAKVFTVGVSSSKLTSEISALL